MNYRHAYHAGNFADVMKHMALALCLTYLKKKESPFCVIDAHGGIGQYNLLGDEASKTKEWQDGVGRFMGDEDLPGEFLPYWMKVEHDLARYQYPGSPTLIARLLRPDDRLIVNELHPEDVVTLEKNMVPFANTRVTHMDAYECIRAHVPPPEKRGLVLIDPPFEKKDEFGTLCTQMMEWQKRWPTGVYVLWYPIKSHLPLADLISAAMALGMHRTWQCECLKHPKDQEGSFNGSGLIIFNAPFTVPESIQNTLGYLKNRMGLHECASSWLTSA